MMEFNNALPLMNSNENDYIKLSCSAYYTSSSTGISFYPYLCCNGTTDSGWNFENQSQPSGGHWLKIQFKDKPRKITKIALRNGSMSSVNIKNFKIHASNDNITYVELFSGIHLYGDRNTTRAEYAFNNTEYYNYYKIIVIDSYFQYRTTYGGIGLLELLEPAGYYFITQNNIYYSIDNKYYDTNGHNFVPLSLSGGLTPNIQDIEQFAFNDVGIINRKMMVGTDEFIPIDKLFTTFELKQYYLKK